MTGINQGDADAFIAKWRGVTASELSTAQTFAMDLCQLLGVEPPHADAEQQYMFERPVTFTHGDGSTSAGRIDLYKRGRFVLEAKKLKAPTHTKGFDDALLRARSQAEQYARALPASEGRPPFLIVLDVGNRIELYAEFSRSGATYTPFPDPRSHRIALDDLRDEKIRARLRTIWTDPLALDPSRESARVTREIAARLATLARSLEAAGHRAEAVAQFLMRCLFTMFAEDVKLLPSESFRDLLLKHAEQPDTAMRMLGLLWHDMDKGGFSGAIASEVLRFNGKLFKQPDTLPLTREQIALLIEAARAKWEHVEPAIFGTLLERALDPDERHKLGAHYTPRAYVERLVLPTVIEPLRREWSDAHAAALTLAAEGKADEAVKTLRAFHHRLCTVRVLDPACGSGNFLYVTLEHLKRLEGEVLNALDELGFRQTGLALDGERADAMGGETVDPHQLLGIELNPRAAAIAEVVLWIGYLQWHYRTRGDINPPQPVIRDFRNIENRDAVLAYDRMEYVLDERGVPVSRWDGVSMKASPVTGEEVPDDSKRLPLERYVNPRKAAWPEADFVVGNPPFIGNKRMRTALGDGYVEALQGAVSGQHGSVVPPRCRADPKRRPATLRLHHHQLDQPDLQPSHHRSRSWLLPLRAGGGWDGVAPGRRKVKSTPPQPSPARRGGSKSPAVVAGVRDSRSSVGGYGGWSGGQNCNDRWRSRISTRPADLPYRRSRRPSRRLRDCHPCKGRNNPCRPDGRCECRRRYPPPYKPWPIWTRNQTCWRWLLSERWRDVSRDKYGD
jgi:hypothetical protein